MQCVIQISMKVCGNIIERIYLPSQSHFSWTFRRFNGSLHLCRCYGSHDCGDHMTPVGEGGDSNHSLDHKRTMVRTLMRRAVKLVSEEDDQRKEIQHVKNVLKVNGYKSWSFNIPKKKERKKEVEKNSQSRSSRKVPVCLPYIPDLSETLSSWCAVLQHSFGLT